MLTAKTQLRDGTDAQVRFTTIDGYFGFYYDDPTEPRGLEVGKIFSMSKEEMKSLGQELLTRGL